MERCEMDVGRSGHGAVAEGGVGVVAASVAVGGDHGHPVVTAGPQGAMWLLKVRFIMEVTEVTHIRAVLYSNRMTRCSHL